MRSCGPHGQYKFTQGRGKHIHTLNDSTCIVSLITQRNSDLDLLTQRYANNINSQSITLTESLVYPCPKSLGPLTQPHGEYVAEAARGAASQCAHLAP